MRIDPNAIVNVEFGVCVSYEQAARYYRVPIVDEAKDSLISILVETQSKLIERSPEPHRYEPSQKYGTTDHLWVSHNDSIAQRIDDLYKSTENIPLDPRAIDQPDALRFYFVIFRIQDGRKVVGIKRAAQFKAIVTARNRLLQISPKALRPVHDNIFKLDHEFDFIADSQRVTILYPAGFEQIADTDNFIRMGAQIALEGVRKRIPFIDFSTVGDYVKGSIRGAKLITSIGMSDNLEDIRLELLCSGCERNDIRLIECNGKFAPSPGHEKAFLEYLDGRRYTFDAVAAPTDRYLAKYRQRVRRKRSK